MLGKLVTQELGYYSTYYRTETKVENWQQAVFTLPFLPNVNGTRRIARVHTASGSSSTLRPHREVFSVDASGTAAMRCLRVCAD